MRKRPYCSGWRDYQLLTLAFCRPYRSDRFTSIAASLFTNWKRRRAAHDWGAHLREDARRFYDGVVPRIQYGD